MAQGVRPLPKGRILIGKLKEKVAQGVFTEVQVLDLINEYAAKPWTMEDVRRYFDGGQEVFILENGILKTTSFDEYESGDIQDDREPVEALPETTRSGAPEEKSSPTPEQNGAQAAEAPKKAETCPEQFLCKEKDCDQCVLMTERIKSLHVEIAKSRQQIGTQDVEIKLLEKEFVEIERTKRNGKEEEEEPAVRKKIPPTNEEPQRVERPMREPSRPQHTVKDFFDCSDNIEFEKSTELDAERILKSLMGADKKVKHAKWCIYLKMFIESEGNSLQALTNGCIVAGILSIKKADRGECPQLTEETDFVEIMEPYILDASD